MRVTEMRVTDIRVTDIRVTDMRVTDIRITDIRVTDIRVTLPSHGWRSPVQTCTRARAQKRTIYMYVRDMTCRITNVFVCWGG